MRLSRPVFVLVLAMAAALGLSAAARADGFSRFQALIAAKAGPDALRFAKGSSLGPSGFVLEDVVITPPPDLADNAKVPVKALPTRIARVVVEDIDFDSLARDKPPLFLRARLEGIVADGKAVPDGEMRKYLGVDSAIVDVTVDYRLDAVRRMFTLGRLELDLRGLVRVELALTVDGVGAEVSDAPQQAAATASLRSASLTINDASLLARLMRAFAAEQGMTVEKQTELLMQTVVMMADGQGPLIEGASRTVAAFLRDWQRTSGPLRIALAPGAKSTFTDLLALGGAEDIVKALGLTVSYAGAPLAPMPAMPRPEPPGNTGAGPSGKLTGAAAIERLVGNTLSATIDGSEIVDYVQPDGTWISKIDAVIAKGRWRRNGDRACFKLPDEDENCYRVEVAGRKVTMIDENDEKEVFDLFDGNAKNL